MNAKIELPSDNFEYYQVTDGVWAAISIPTGLAASNSGIIDSGEDTVVFDTTLSPASAVELRDVAKQLTGRDVSYVFNSHKDVDHVCGNSVFSAQTKIHATARTSELMAEHLPRNIEDFKKQWTGFLKEWPEKAKNAADEAERLDYEQGVAFAQKVVNALPQLEMRLPDETFEDEFVLKGPKRTLRFMTYGGGHTDSDAFLYLPEDRVIFAGDLLATQFHSGMNSGHPQEWIQILQKMEKLEPLHLVPGHGNIGTVEDLRNLEKYIQELLDMSDKNFRNGGSAEDAAAMTPPAFTEGWANAEGFANNMKFLHELMQKSS